MFPIETTCTLVPLKIELKTLTALKGQLSLSVGWKMVPDWDLKLFHLIPNFL